MDPQEVQRRLDVAWPLARQAGKLTMTLFQRDDVAVERKSDNSPVTQADRQAEQLIRQEVARQFPEDAFLGEEFGEEEGTSGFRWIVDPIDGTKSFITGVPLYGTMIGIEWERESVAGVVYIPGLDEGVYARVGGGAWFVRGESEPVAASVSQRDSLADAVFLTSQVDSFGLRHAAEAYRELESACYITRTWGDCYGYLLVATGRADIMVDPIMSVWDAAALQPIIEEAGGKFTDWTGQPTIHSEEGLATTPALFEQVVGVTARFPKPSQ